MRGISNVCSNNIIKLLTLSCTLVLLGCGNNPEEQQSEAQQSLLQQSEQIAMMGEMQFPEIIGADIPGAPMLQQPMLVMGGDTPVITEKHGLAAPALWDWNMDGKRDLLVGEFETNSGEDFPMSEDGSTVRVYLNIGSNDNPQFSQEFEWARDTAGTIMEVEQWCCIGFTPYFYDLDDDGYEDMITGQYHPGEVTWFRGSEEGFLPGVKLSQEGDPAAAWSPLGVSLSDNSGEADIPDRIETYDYWVYSSASMGDFDDDGDYDLIIGGSALKISENIGNKTEPKFGRRELLLDVNGKPLTIGAAASDEDIEGWAQMSMVAPAGDFKTSPYVVDWDRDGILDLLVTGSYREEGSKAVAFFRGAKVDGEHRFHPAVDLLATEDGSKALPGSGPRLYVDDWNLDGTPDLIIGASVATVNGGEFSDELSWEWEDNTEIESAGKDPGIYPPLEKPTREALLAEYEEIGGWWESDEEFDEFLQMQVNYWEETVGVLYDTGREHWLTMRHQGRIYVMLGTEPDDAETADSQLPTPKLDKNETSQSDADSKLPVKLELVVPETVDLGSTAEVSLTIDIKDGWYIYAPTGKNSEQGMKETKVSFTVPDSIQQIGKVKMPIHQFKGSYDVFRGSDLAVIQKIGTEDSAPGEYTIESTVTYQTCNDDICLPPKTVELSAVLLVASK